jgi:hypothetical protein
MRSSFARSLFFGLLVVMTNRAMADGAKKSNAELEPTTVPELMHPRKIIIGVLGVPLGTVVEIEATIVSGNDVPENSPNMDRAFFLSVAKVGETILPQPKVIGFSVPFSAVNLPVSYDDLPSSKNVSLNPSELKDALRREIRQYVGSRHRLVVYEAGRIDGVPKSIPEDCMVWAGRVFGYEPYLVVLKTR